MWPAQEQHNSFYSGLSCPVTESIIAPGFPYALPLFTFRTLGTNLLRTGTPTAEFRYNVILEVSEVAVIPLPAALPLFITGLAGLGLLRRRKRQV